VKEEYQQGYDDALSDVLKLCTERKKIAELYNMKDVISCWDKLETALSGQFSTKIEGKK